MYGLPSGLDLSFFRNRILTQICLGCHDFIWNFDEGVSISVTSSLAFAFPDGTYRRYENLPEAGSAAIALLDQRVVSAMGNAEGTLSLEFERGVRVEIFDDNPHYETYTITNRKQVIVV